MKIGTKANVIDDLGKFDGSKMTIKVDGKQIYPQKKYAIVRIYDEQCPVEYGIENICSPNGCESCIMSKRYGDTKEQLIAKVETAIEIAINKYEKGEILLANKNKALAEIIVEFLGVEE